MGRAHVGLTSSLTHRLVTKRRGKRGSNEPGQRHVEVAQVDQQHGDGIVVGGRTGRELRVVGARAIGQLADQSLAPLLLATLKHPQQGSGGIVGTLVDAVFEVFVSILGRCGGEIALTALGYRQFMKETRPNEWRLKSTTYAAPFSGKQRSPVYCVPERTAGKWSVLSDNAKVDGQGAATELNSGISCILPDKEEERTLYLCNRHGIYKSTDGGQSYRIIHTCSQ